MCGVLLHVGMFDGVLGSIAIRFASFDFLEYRVKVSPVDSHFP